MSKVMLTQHNSTLTTKVRQLEILAKRSYWLMAKLRLAEEVFSTGITAAIIIHVLRRKVLMKNQTDNKRKSPITYLCTSLYYAVVNGGSYVEHL